MAVAIAAGGTFVSRVFAGDMAHMKETFKQAISHKGFALVDVFQPCVTFNKLNTFQWWQQRVYKLEGTGHDPKNKSAALEKALEETSTNYEKIPIGIFYKEERATYEMEAPQLQSGPLVKHAIMNEAIEKAYEEFM